MNIEQIGRDIALFADPYTEPRVRDSAAGLRIDLVRNARNVSVVIRKADGAIDTKPGHRFPNAQSFLASERMADLDRLVETQKREAGARHDVPPIPSRIRVDGEMLSIEHLSSWLAEPSSRTKLLLLDGPAGIGKTFQIEHMVKRHCAEYLAGKKVPPILNVTSKGRRLSNLRDVLSAATQDSNAAFHGRHVPVLVRNCLLIVAVDGFDELVDADGYDDSWKALRHFIAEVNSGGAIVLAARDTFVEQQELLDRIERSAADIDLKMASVMLPEAAEARAWLAKSGNWKATDLNSSTTDDVLVDGGYALRPVFLRALWGQKGWGEIVAEGPRAFFVGKLVKREANLIAQQIGGITSEAVLQPLRMLMREIAVEMAVRESDSVELDHLEFLMRFAFDGIIDERGVRKLSHKAGSTALLELTREGSARRFLHSEVQHFFLGEQVLESFLGGSFSSFLRRHALSSEELEVFAEVFESERARLAGAAVNCQSLLNVEVAHDCLAPNLGALMLLFMGLGVSSRIDFVSVVEGTVARMAPVGVVESSKFERLDACGADLTGLRFVSTSVGVLSIDASTVFGATAPGISQLEVRDASGSRVVRDAAQIGREVIDRTRISEDTDEGRAKRLLERVARRAVRHFYLRAAADDDGAELLADRQWPVVRDVLTRRKRLELVGPKPMHGRPTSLFRVKRPLDLLDLSNKETKTIIAEIISEVREGPKR